MRTSALLRRSAIIISLSTAFALLAAAGSAVATLPPSALSPGSAPTVITGKVVTQDGTPVAGAWVEIWGNVLETSGQTNTDGTYVADVERPGTFPVLCVADGYSSAGVMRQPIAADGSTVCNFTLAPGGPVTFLGQLVELDSWDSPTTPLPGVRVTVYEPDGSTVVSSTVSRADGTFEIDDLPTGSLEAAYSKAGYYGTSGLVGMWWTCPVAGPVWNYQITMPIAISYPNTSAITVTRKNGVGSYKLSAHLTAQQSTPASHARMYLQRFNGKKWVTVAARKTNPKGNTSVKFRVKRRQRIYYSWYAPPVGTHGSVRTRVQKVVVK